MLEERPNYPSIPSIEKGIIKSLFCEDVTEEYVIIKYNKRVL
jgi:hypothetical protein